MVVIRSLQPKLAIRMPTKAPGYRPSRQVAETRRAVDHPSPTPQPTPCRLWQGGTDQGGYGTKWVVSVSSHGHVGRKKVRVYRWVVEQAYGRALRSKEVVMHKCDNRLCYRLDHLQVGTHRENNHDMMAKGRYVHAGGKPKRGLTGWQKSAIRRRYLSGWGVDTIAAEMGVSKSSVREQVHGLNGAWRYEGNRLISAPRTDPAGFVRGERNRSVKQEANDEDVERGTR